MVHRSQGLQRGSLQKQNLRGVYSVRLSVLQLHIICQLLFSQPFLIDEETKDQRALIIYPRHIATKYKVKPLITFSTSLQLILSIGRTGMALDLYRVRNYQIVGKGEMGNILLCCWNLLY